MTNNDKYKEGYERVFGDPEVKKGHWLFDKEKGKFVSAEEFKRTEVEGLPAIMRPLDEFVSPIDGSVINDRAQLRRHNERHGVTNLADFGENDGKAYFERKSRERGATIQGATREAKMERRELINKTLSQHGY